MSGNEEGDWPINKDEYKLNSHFPNRSLTDKKSDRKFAFLNTDINVKKKTAMELRKLVLFCVRKN